MTERPPTPVHVDAKPVAGAPSVSARQTMRRATLLSVLTSPRSWMRFFRDKDAPKGPKVLAVLALLYVLSPVDVLPDFALPIVGLLDDLGVAAFASAWLASIAAKYENNKQPDALPPGTPNS